MRAVLVILIVVIVAAIAAIATGYLNISQLRSGQAPAIRATHNGISATGGQAPAFDVETGSVKVGSKPATVAVPTLEVRKPGQNQAEPATNQSK